MWILTLRRITLRFRLLQKFRWSGEASKRLLLWLVSLNRWSWPDFQNLIALQVQVSVVLRLQLDLPNLDIPSPWSRRMTSLVGAAAWSITMAIASIKVPHFFCSPSYSKKRFMILAPHSKQRVLNCLNANPIIIFGLVMGRDSSWVRMRRSWRGK